MHLRGEFTGAFNDWQTLVGLEIRDTELTAPHHEEEADANKRMTKKSTAFCRTRSALNMVCLLSPSVNAMIG